MNWLLCPGRKKLIAQIFLFLVYRIACKRATRYLFIHEYFNNVIKCGITRATMAIRLEFLHLSIIILGATYSLSTATTAKTSIYIKIDAHI